MFGKDLSSPIPILLYIFKDNLSCVANATGMEKSNRDVCKSGSFHHSSTCGLTWRMYSVSPGVTCTPVYLKQVQCQSWCHMYASLPEASTVSVLVSDVRPLSCDAPVTCRRIWIYCIKYLYLVLQLVPCRLYWTEANSIRLTPSSYNIIDVLRTKNIFLIIKLWM